MSTKIYSVLHGCARSLALVAMLCMPFLSVTAFAALSNPTDVTVINLTPTSGTLQWEVALASSHDYDIIVSTSALSSSVLGNATTPCTVTAETQGVVVFAGQIALADVTTYALTGLTEGTHYYGYIRQNGTSQYEDHSDWVTFEFSTPCQATSVLPVLANFDEGQYLPSCWSAGTKTPTYSSVIKHESGNSMCLSATAQEGCFVYSPVFASNAHAYNLTAYVYGPVGAVYRVGVAAASDLLSIEPVLEGTIATANTWQPIDAAIPTAIQAELEQGLEYVWVIYNSAADDAKSFYVDDVVIDEIPSCVSPAGLTATDITDVAVTLSWTERGTANAWVIEYANATDTLTQNVSANPYTLTGLQENTAYTFRVKAVCSSTDESAWSQSITAKTFCGVKSLPYSENFDECAAGGGVASSRPANAVMPDCWDWNGESGLYCLVDASTSYAQSGKSLHFRAYSSATADYAYALLPAVNAENAATIMTLSYKYESATSGGDLEVGYLTTAGDVTSYVFVKTLTRVTTFTEVEITFPAMAVLNAVIRYAKPSSSYWDAGVDNLTIVKAPNCLKPSALDFLEATSSTVKLQIHDAEDANAWEYAVGDTLNPVAVSDTIFTITGLESDSTYTVYLRRVCSDTDKSLWLSRSVFTTGAPVDAVYEDFDGANPMSGWSALYRTSTSYPTISSTGGVDGTKGLYFYAYSSSAYSGIFALPEITGNIADYRFFFDLKKSSSTGAGDILFGVADALGGEITYIDSITPSNTAFETHQMDLTSYTGSGKFPILYVRNLQTTTYIDNIVLEPIPTCDRPTGLTVTGITATSVTVEITDTVEAHSAWEVVVVAQNANPSTGTPVAVSEKTATIDGTFASGEYYDVYVRAVCGEDDKSTFRGPVTFTFIDYSSVTDLTVQGVGNYPWEIVEDNGINKLQSTNQGQHGTESDVMVTVVIPETAEATLSFDYYASSEGATYDYLCIYIDQPNPTTSNYNTDFGKKGGTSAQTGSYTIALEPGTHTIRWRYRKDSSVNGGDDLARVWNIQLHSNVVWAPKNFELRSVGITTADVAWTQCENVDKNEVMLDSTLFETTTNNIVFNDLASSTAYHVKVRSIVGNDTTDWSDTFTFRTDCAARAIPFAESFEGDGDELCWHVVGNAVTISTTNVAFDGEKAAKVVNDSVAGMLVSPMLDATTLADYEVSLAINLATVRYHGDLKPLTIGVMTDPSDVSTYIDLGDIVIPSSGSWKEYRFSLADLATADYAEWAGAQYIVVSMSDSATYYFDAISVSLPAQCAKPTALDIQPNGEEVVVAWVSEATDHYAEIALGDSVVFAGNVQNPFTPAGLAANTNYKVRVRAICGEDNSEWTPWTNFKTPCSYAELPFEEGFESYTNTTFPDCWDKYIVSGPGTTGFVVNATSGTSYTHTGSHSLKLNDMQATTYSLAVLPMFNSPIEDGLTLSFWMYRTTGSYHSEEGIRVWVNSVPSLEGATALMHVTRYGGVEGDSLKVAPITTAGWYQFETVLPLAGAEYVMFEGISEYGSASYIDDIRVIETPACVKPSGLQIGELTTTTAQLNWNAGLSETAWQLTYKLSTSASVDTVVVTNTPSYTIEGLAVGTSYTLSNLSLQAICSATDSSEVVTFENISFNTVCDVKNLPLEEDFNSITAGIPACWDNSQGTTTTESYKWYYNASGLTGGCLRFDSYMNGSGNTNILVSPVYNVGNTTQVNISLQYKNPAGGRFDILFSHDGGVTFTDTLGANLTASAWTALNAQVTVVPNELVALAFSSVSNYGSGTAYHFIDDVVITSPSVCSRPEAVTVSGITTESATISIVDPEGSAWEYVVGNADPVAVSATTFELTGLSAQTYYTVYVRRVCGAGDVSGWREVTFMTACGGTDLPYADNFDQYTENIPTYSSRPTSGELPLPDCWTIFNESGDASTYPQAFLTSNSSYAVSGNTFFVKMSNATPLVAVLPSFNLTAATNVLVEFSYRNEGTGTYNGHVQLGYITDMDDLESFVLVNECEQVTSMTAQEAVFSLPAGAKVAYRFVGGQSNNYYASIDNVRVSVAPECDRPVSISVLGCTGSSVDVLIEDTIAEHTAWEVVTVLKDADPSTGTPVAVSTLAATVPGTFASGVEYDAYVRTACGATDRSAYRGPATFRFVDYSAATDVPMAGVGEYPWTVNASSHLESTNQAVSSSTSDMEGTFVVPEGSLATVSFQYYASSEGTSYDYLCMYIDEANPTTTNYDTNFGKKGGTSGQTGTFSFQLTAGTHKVLWRYCKDGSVNGGDDKGEIWDIQTTYSYFFVPNNLGVDSLAALSANLTWSAGNDATLNEVVLVSENNDTLVATTPNSYLHVALVEETTYTFKVRSFNAANDTTAWSSAYTFTTPELCPKPTNVEVIDFTAAQVSLLITDPIEGHQAWQVALGAQGFDPDSVGAQVVDVDSKLVAIVPAEALVSGNYYDVRVRTVCDETLVGGWTAATTFKYVDVSTASDISLNMNEGEYPWELVVVDGVSKLQSTNQGVGNSESDMTATVIVNENQRGRLTFNYYASGEAYEDDESDYIAPYDYLCIYIDEAAPNTYNYETDFAYYGQAGGVSGMSGVYEKSLAPGTHTIRWRFRKDWSGDDGDDLGQVWNIHFLSVNVVNADTIYDATCAGGDYTGYGFNIAASQLRAGNNIFKYTKPAVSDLESDTVFTLKLFVNEASVTTITDTICAHEHYTGYGFDIASADPLRTTPYVRHLTNEFGCDSTVSLTLFVPQTEFAETKHFCQGDSYTFGDSIITTSGVYVHTYQNQFGCDSTITLDIFFHGTSAALEANICPGESYTFGSQTLTAAGTYTEVFQNAGGCDSTVTLTLNVIQPVVTNFNGVFCEGTTFAGGSISPKFMDLNVPGTYTDTLQSVLTGCDSILVLNLTMESTQYTTVEGTCSDGHPYVYDGQSYQEAGTFTITKTTVNGCDSIITLVVTFVSALDNLEMGDLQINPNPVAVGEEAIINTEIAFSDDYVLRVYDAVGRLVVESKNANGHVPALPVAGVYTVRIVADDHNYQSKLIVK